MVPDIWQGWKEWQSALCAWLVSVTLYGHLVRFLVDADKTIVDLTNLSIAFLRTTHGGARGLEQGGEWLQQELSYAIHD